MINKEPLNITFPEDIGTVRAMGYACGLNSGMLSPLYDGRMPPSGPVRARGPIKTNDPKQFSKLFREGHDQGFTFGAEAAYELAETLSLFPLPYWWPICACFAGELMEAKDNEMLYNLNPLIKQGTDDFRKIYRKHFFN